MWKFSSEFQEARIGLLNPIGLGTNLRDQLATRRPGKTGGRCRYQPDGKTRYSGDLVVADRGWDRS